MLISNDFKLISRFEISLLLLEKHAVHLESLYYMKTNSRKNCIEYQIQRKKL